MAFVIQKKRILGAKRSTTLYGTLVILVGLLVWSHPTQAVTVKLAWDPNPETNITGYRVYFGTSSGGYTNTIDIGTNTTASVSNLSVGNTYYFAVTARNTATLESQPSTEVAVTPALNQINTSTLLSNGSFQITLQGDIGRTNSVQVSSDLKVWSTITNAVNSTGTLTINDPSAKTASRRYYRIWAGSFYLTNVVGFTKVTVPPGYSIIANQLIPSTNMVAAIFPNVPPGTTLLKFRPTTGDYAINEYDVDFRLWQEPNQRFEVGDAAFILNPTTNDFIVTFQGSVPQGTLSMNILSGYSMIGSMTPQSGLLQTDLGYQPRGGETVFQFHQGTFDLISYYDPDFFQWDVEPRLNVGEGFFLLAPMASAWTRTFSATY